MHPAEDTDRRSGFARPDAEGHFALRGLPAGRVRLRVVALGLEIAAIEHVVVEAGAIARDPRLDPLDLRHAWRVVRLDVVAEHGPPPGEVRVDVRRGEELDWERFSSPRILLASDGQPLDLTVRADAFLPVHIPACVRDGTVSLRPAPRVLLELIGVPPPRAPLLIEAQLTNTERESDPAPVAERVELDAEGRAACRPGFVGEARLRLKLVDRSNGKRAPLALPDKGRVELLDTELEQRFELAVAPAALADAMARLRR